VGLERGLGSKVEEKLEDPLEWSMQDALTF
jgi:hypothetical protein